MSAYSEVIACFEWYNIINNSTVQITDPRKQNTLLSGNSHIWQAYHFTRCPPPPPKCCYFDVSGGGGGLCVQQRLEAIAAGVIVPDRFNHAEQALVEGPDKIQHTADVGTISVGWHLCDLVVGPFSQSPGLMSYDPMTRKAPVVACIICHTLTHFSVAQSPKLVVLVVKSAVRPTYCNSDARYPGMEVTRPAA